MEHVSCFLLRTSWRQGMGLFLIGFSAGENSKVEKLSVIFSVSFGTVTWETGRKRTDFKWAWKSNSCSKKINLFLKSDNLLLGFLATAHDNPAVFDFLDLFCQGSLFRGSYYFKKSKFSNTVTRMLKLFLGQKVFHCNVYEINCPSRWRLISDLDVLSLYNPIYLKQALIIKSMHD